MSRNADADLITETQAPALRPIFLSQLDFESEAVYAWTGAGTLNWNGHDFLGLGNFASVAVVSETGDLSAQVLRLGLSGIPTEMIALALGETYKGRDATLWIAALAANGSLVGQPYQLAKGAMDVMSGVEGGATSTIALTVEDALIEFDDPNGGRWTDEDQKRRYPGDRGLEFVAGLQEKTVAWGRAA